MVVIFMERYFHIQYYTDSLIPIKTGSKVSIRCELATSNDKDDKDVFLLKIQRKNLNVKLIQRHFVNDL